MNEGVEIVLVCFFTVGKAGDSRRWKLPGQRRFGLGDEVYGAGRNSVWTTTKRMPTADPATFGVVHQSVSSCQVTFGKAEREASKTNLGELNAR